MNNDCAYWDNWNGAIPNTAGILAYSAALYHKGEIYGTRLMEEEMQRSYTAVMFPPKAADDKGQQVQQMNYSTFIRTMADMVKKYGPRLMN